ncbi:MAG: hypothetical protein H0V54_02075 [Chthoniobacterales bacterium]|nr:hypothetical protein [Chthoniobacterales bacterium]
MRRDHLAPHGMPASSSPYPDQLAIGAFQRWPCQPGVYQQVYVPITFTLSGAEL